MAPQESRRSGGDLSVKKEQFNEQASEIKTIFEAISDPRIDTVRCNQLNEINGSFLINEWNKNDIIQDNQKYFDVIKSE